jgi:hypothetical protein
MLGTLQNSIHLAAAMLPWPGPPPEGKCLIHSLLRPLVVGSSSLHGGRHTTSMPASQQGSCLRCLVAAAAWLPWHFHHPASSVSFLHVQAAQALNKHPLYYPDNILLHVQARQALTRWPLSYPDCQKSSSLLLKRGSIPVSSKNTDCCLQGHRNHGSSKAADGTAWQLVAAPPMTPQEAGVGAQTEEGLH